MQITIKQFPITGETPDVTLPLPELQPHLVFRDGMHTVMQDRVYYAWEDLIRDLNRAPADAGVEIRLFRESLE